MVAVFDNPLIHPVRTLLASAGRSLTEHEIIRYLQDSDASFPVLAVSARLALFQTHFLIMNALYQLQDQLLGEGIYLHISALEITLRPITETTGNKLTSPGVDDELKRYYCNWDNFNTTDEQDVDRLLRSFWEHYLAKDRQVDAYQALQLEPGCSWSEIKKAYRRLASDCHPDRGGSHTEFIMIREAYEVLARTVGTDSGQGIVTTQ